MLLILCPQLLALTTGLQCVLLSGVQFALAVEDSINCECLLGRRHRQPPALYNATATATTNLCTQALFGTASTADVITADYAAAVFKPQLKSLEAVAACIQDWNGCMDSDEQP